MKNSLRNLVFAILITLLCGCGAKGPLFMPEEAAPVALPAEPEEAMPVEADDMDAIPADSDPADEAPVDADPASPTPPDVDG